MLLAFGSLILLCRFARTPLRWRIVLLALLRSGLRLFALRWFSLAGTQGRACERGCKEDGKSFAAL